MTPEGQIDFRIPPGVSISYQQRYTPLAYDSTIQVAARREVACAERRNQFAGPVPWHLTREQITYIPEAKAGEIALDLGCGAGIHRSVLETLGYRYHGVDYAGAAADDLVDAHALPYTDSTFDLVFAIALLEHLAQPVRVMQEVQRVLNASKHFIGTAAFLEPFHDNSFSHLSPLGLSNALQSSGFAVEAILAIRGWNAIRAQLEMGFERARLPRWISHLLSQPFVWAMEVYAFAGRSFASDKSRHSRDLAHARHAGAFFFVARKPTLTR